MKGLATDPADRFASAESFGVALAQPAAQCWGPDWLAPVGIPVIGADTIVAAATVAIAATAGNAHLFYLFSVVLRFGPITHLPGQ